MASDKAKALRWAWRVESSRKLPPDMIPRLASEGVFTTASNAGELIDQLDPDGAYMIGGPVTNVLPKVNEWMYE